MTSLYSHTCRTFTTMAVIAGNSYLDFHGLSQDGYVTAEETDGERYVPVMSHESRKHCAPARRESCALRVLDTPTATLAQGQIH